MSCICRDIEIIIGHLLNVVEQTILEFGSAGFDVRELCFQKCTIIELYVAHKHATKRTVHETAIGIDYVIHG